MQIYSTKKQILNALKLGIKLKRTETPNGGYVTISDTSFTANLNSYKALLKDNSIEETNLGFKQVCSLWGVTEFQPKIKS